MIKSIFAWHITPTVNVNSILKFGLKPNSPEPDGDLAISLFKTKEDALIQTNLWLRKKWNGQALTLLHIDVTGIPLTETFPYELITTSADKIDSIRILSSFELP
jgi:hypothetical protein